MTIPIAGLDSTGFPPGTFIEIDFAAGATSLGTAVYGLLLIGNKLSTGDATADTVIYGPANGLTSLTDAQNRFGIGSELYRMYKRALQILQGTSIPISAIAVLESVGAKASKNITLATTATANGTLRVMVEDEFEDVAITSGDTADTIKTNAIAAINKHADWPVAATSGGTGIITLTAQQKGLRGNWIRVGSQIIGSGVGTTTDTAPMAFLTSGTTADSYTNVLATIKPYRFYYLVSADDGGQSSTNLSGLLTQVASQAQPTTGIRQVVCAASNDGTLSNLTTQATGINNARLVPYVYLPFSDIAPCELATITAATRAFVELSFGATTLNFDGFGTTTMEGVGDTSALWPVPAPRSGAQLTSAQIITCLNNGITPVGVNAQGKTYIVSLITAKSQTASVADYRIRDGHKVSICDRFGDDAGTKCKLQLSAKAIGDDPKDSQRPIAGVATPRNLKALLIQLIRDYGGRGLVQNANDVIGNMTVDRATSPTTRLESAVPLQTADVVHQVTVLVSQVA
jgi:phage tail sheath gpL-like